MSVETASAEAAYLTKPNILHPETRAAQITALEAKGRQDMADHRNGVTVTGGNIKKGA